MKTTLEKIVECPVIFNASLALLIAVIFVIAAILIAFFNVEIAMWVLFFGLLSSMGTGVAGLMIADYD